MSMSCLRIRSSSKSSGPSYTWPTVTPYGKVLASSCAAFLGRPFCSPGCGFGGLVPLFRCERRIGGQMHLLGRCCALSFRRRNLGALHLGRNFVRRGIRACRIVPGLRGIRHRAAPAGTVSICGRCIASRTCCIVWSARERARADPSRESPTPGPAWLQTRAAAPGWEPVQRQPRRPASLCIQCSRYLPWCSLPAPSAAFRRRKKSCAGRRPGTHLDCQDHCGECAPDP